MSYIVKIPATYSCKSTDFDISEIGLWLKQCGITKWKWIDVQRSKDYLGIAMSFKNEKDAIMFKLRWL